MPSGVPNGYLWVGASTGSVKHRCIGPVNHPTASRPEPDRANATMGGMQESTTSKASAAPTPIPAPTYPRLETGQPAPDFRLPSDSGATVKLSDILAQGRKAIVYFYPAAMTPGCTKEACDFRDNLNRLTADGYTVLGISKDLPDRLARFRERDHLTFPLLSDADLAVHKAYGAYGEKKLYGKVHVGAIRSTFVIGENGTLLIARYNVRATGHVDSLLRQLGKLSG